MFTQQQALTQFAYAYCGTMWNIQLAAATMTDILQVEAMTMADRIVVLQGWVVEQIGTLLELDDRPANQFVAAFIGSPSMNFIRGRVWNDTFMDPAVKGRKTCLLHQLKSLRSPP